MPKAYLIVHIDVADAETYQTYIEQAPALIAAAGGRYLARGGESDDLEGEMPGSRHVIVEFDSMTDARNFYHGEAYQKILGIRLGSTNGAAVLTEGLA